MGVAGKRPNSSARFNPQTAAGEDIKLKGIEQVPEPVGSIYLAAVTFSNGEVIVFSGGGPGPPSCAGAGSGCVWNVAEPDQNRRFVQAAAPPE